MLRYRTYLFVFYLLLAWFVYGCSIGDTGSKSINETGDSDIDTTNADVENDLENLESDDEVSTEAIDELAELSGDGDEYEFMEFDDEESSEIELECVSIDDTLPAEVSLPQPEPNGIFDPNLAYDPASGRLWVVYSGVDGKAGVARVSTHLAYSEDGGHTWCGGWRINAATNVSQSELPAGVSAVSAFWNNETPALVFDEFAPANERWRLVWHKYLLLDDGEPGTEDRHFEYGWIAQKKASNPEGLLDAPEEKLFSSLAYHSNPSIEEYNNAAEGGLPKKSWVGDPNLGSCIVFAEPGMLALDGKLYVAMYCYKSANQQDIVLVEFDHSTHQWQYVNTLLTVDDAHSLNSQLSNFNAADLVESDHGESLLLVSPAVNGTYVGCLAYRLNLADGTVSKSDPVVWIPKQDLPNLIQSGACTYQKQSFLGLVIGNTWLDGIQFRLKATGTSL